MFTLFDHTADLGIRVSAQTLECLFADAARALYSVIVENPEQIEPRKPRTIVKAGAAPDYLLFDWLNELLQLFESERLLLSEFRIKADDGGITAEVRGEAFDPARHRLAHEVKAITYHGLQVKRSEEGWIAEVIIDI